MEKQNAAGQPPVVNCEEPALAHGPLTEEERRQYEQKLSRLFEWVGVRVPDDVVVDGHDVPLHDTIWKLVNKDRLTPDDEAFLRELEDKLDQKFKADRESIRTKDVTEDQATKDYCEAVGLLRAIVTLKDVEARENRNGGATSPADALNENKKEQARRWLEYLKQLRGP